MSRTARRIVVAGSICVGFGLFAYVVMAAVALSTTSAYTQNFDGIGIPATSTTPGTLPADFKVDAQTSVRTVGTFLAATTATARAGGANLSTTAANGIYNFGAGTTPLGGSDRAVGFLASGTATTSGNLYAQLANNTGSPLSGLQIAYNVEKYRGGSNAAGFRIQLFYSTDGATWTNAGANFLTGFGADLTNAGFGTAPGVTVAVNQALNVTIPDASTFYLAWNYSVASGSTVTNAQALAIDDISILGLAGPTGPTGTGNANPGSVAAGGSTFLTVAVTPGANPSSTGLGVTADLTAIGGSPTQAFFDDGTNGDAISGDNVFSYQAAVSASTPEGTKALPATITDAQSRSGTASIALLVNAPPPAFVEIHDIQGPGTRSPYAGQRVLTHGVVTAQRFNNGFFIQTPDAQADADPHTSEGIFVFTNTGNIPAAAAIGNIVEVTGTVQEFVPSTDPNSPPQTEIAGALTVSALSTGNPLPAGVTLTAADADLSASGDAWERFEGMRVHIESLTVVAPTQGNINEANATASTNGVYYGVITGVARPFREPGLELPDPLPAGAPCCVPRFDANPERLRVDSNGQVGFGPNDTTEVMAGAIVTGVTGVVDYGSRAYTILPDVGAQGVSSNLHNAIPVMVPRAHQFTVGTANIERFFDTVDDPGVSDVRLTAAAFSTRLNKVSKEIRDIMQSPDIIGFDEVENLGVLQAIANKVNADAAAGGGADPQYQAYLVEGNDIGGIDVGFLVKSTRVIVNDVQQLGKDTTFVDPADHSVDLLNDRPPLVMRATMHTGVDGDVDVTVIANHLRSLSGIDDPADGPRIRAKRLAQAEYLARLIQERQALGERVIAVGDFNAFQFSDGYVDVMNTIRGDAPPADQVLLASNAGDLVEPNLVDLVDVAPATERYSFSFDGNAQELDHVLVTQSLLPIFESIQWGRVNADFPETFRSDPTRPERVSDHDPIVAYFRLSAKTTTTVEASPTTVPYGTDVTLTASVAAADVTVGIGSVAFSDGAGFSQTQAVSGGVAAVTVNTAAFGTGPAVLGPHTVTAAYNDALSFGNSQGSATFTVVDQVAPELSTLNDIVVEANGPDGSIVTFAPTATDAVYGAVAVGCSPASGSTFPIGATTVTCSAHDGSGNSTSGSFTVTVRDTIGPPAPALTVSPAALWPANHKLVPVSIGAVSVDPVSGNASCSIRSVTSSEPDSGTGDGDTAGDWIITGPRTANLRAERSGGGNGRTYTLLVSCVDAAGNAGASSTINVIVPHDRGK